MTQTHETNIGNNETTQIENIVGRLSCFSAEELIALKIEAPCFMVNPIIPRGRLIMGVGDSTQGKTPFCVQLARDVAGSRDFLDLYKHNQEQTRVALLDAESPKEDLALRLKMQQLGRPIEMGGRLSALGVDEVLREGFDLTKPGLDRLQQFVSGLLIDLLILDNLWALSGGRDILKAHEVQAILHEMRRITRLPHSPSVLFVHHPRKTHDRLPDILKDDFARWAEEASGSRVLFNLTDVRFGLQRTEIEGEGYTVFRGRSRVPGSQQDFGPIYMTVDDEHCLASKTRGQELIKTLGEKEKAVLDALRNQRRFGVREAKEATGGDISEKTIRRAFKHGCQFGILLDVGIGFYGWA